MDDLSPAVISANESKRVSIRNSGAAFLLPAGVLPMSASQTDHRLADWAGLVAPLPPVILISYRSLLTDRVVRHVILLPGSWADGALRWLRKWMDRYGRNKAQTYYSRLQFRSPTCAHGSLVCNNCQSIAHLIPGGGHVPT